MQRKIFLGVLLLALLAGCTSVTQDKSASGTTEAISIVEATAVAGAEKENGSIKANLNDGPGIAALINKNYNESTSSCTEYGTGTARGLYFCSGVLLRTTDNGAFNPWEASSTAVQLRGISYSWIRQDVGTTTFYKRAGFILLSPADVLAGAVPGIDYPMYGRNTMVFCVYPFDAWTTRTMNRGYYGCDLEGTGLGPPGQNSSWGSCDNRLGLTTAAQWNNHFSSVGQVNYQQCSWAADNTQGWHNMIASRRNFTGQYSWNEVMLWSGGPDAATVNLMNNSMQAWTVAFFYDVNKAGSLADAQAFQQKMAATGKRVPILKLNFQAATATRFEFVAADQVVYP